MNFKKIVFSIIFLLSVFLIIFINYHPKNISIEKNNNLIFFKAIGIDSESRILFPFYIYPNASNISQVVSANSYRNIDVILNPYNGVGASISSAYSNGISQFRVGNVGVYGYVYSKWGARDISIVKSEIDQWQSWYAVDGIFIDEASNSITEMSYYAELYRYISSKGMKVILNPGTSTIEPYTNVADSNCFYESDPSKALVAPAWMANYPASEFCVLQYGASIEQMRSTIQWVKTHNVGFVYVTNATSHYWSSIPPYLSEEASLLAGGKIFPTISPSATIMPTIFYTSTKTPTLTVPSSSPTPSKTPTVFIPTPTPTPTSSLTSTPTPIKTSSPTPTKIGYPVYVGTQFIGFFYP